jgi:hypothetical protein
MLKGLFSSLFASEHFERDDIYDWDLLSPEALIPTPEGVVPEIVVSVPEGVVSEKSVAVVDEVKMNEVVDKVGVVGDKRKVSETTSVVVNDSGKGDVSTSQQLSKSQKKKMKKNKNKVVVESVV